MIRFNSEADGYSPDRRRFYAVADARWCWLCTRPENNMFSGFLLSANHRIYTLISVFTPRKEFPTERFLFSSIKLKLL